MKIYRLPLIALSVLSPLTLAACGDGYEAVEIRNQVPYTEERTAGPGIAYVLAHMMPEKTLVLPSETQTKVKDAAPIFEKKMEKK